MSGSLLVTLADSGNGDLRASCMKGEPCLQALVLVERPCFPDNHWLLCAGRHMCACIPTHMQTHTHTEMEKWKKKSPVLLFKMNTCVLSVCFPPNSSSHGEDLDLPVVVVRGGAFGFMWDHRVRCHDSKGPYKKRDKGTGRRFLLPLYLVRTHGASGKWPPLWQRIRQLAPGSRIPHPPQ